MMASLSRAESDRPFMSEASKGIGCLRRGCKLLDNVPDRVFHAAMEEILQCLLISNLLLRDSLSKHLKKVFVLKSTYCHRKGSTKSAKG